MLSSLNKYSTMRNLPHLSSPNIWKQWDVHISSTNDLFLFHFLHENAAAVLSQNIKCSFLAHLHWCFLLLNAEFSVHHGKKALASGELKCLRCPNGRKFPHYNLCVKIQDPCSHWQLWTVNTCSADNRWQNLSITHTHTHREADI